jgi:outer membrane protein OmpA-like peptidoglycan-associated protein
MRNLILGISIVCLALSGLITFKALTLPENNLRDSASQPPITIHESSQVINDTVLEPAVQQEPGSNVNQTLQNTVSHLEQKLENNITDSQMNIQTLEKTVKQLEQKLADKIAYSQKDTQSAQDTTDQFEQKLTDKLTNAQINIQTLENTVKQLEQKLTDKIAYSQKDTQSAQDTTDQLEQKLTDKLTDAQINIQTLENTVKQLEQKLTDKIAYSQKDTQSAQDTTDQLEQKLTNKLTDAQINIQTLENTVKQLERKLADKIDDSQTDTQSATNTIPQPKQKTAPHSQDISNIGEPENTEKSSGQLLFSVSFDSGKFVINNSTQKLIQQSTQHINSLPSNYRVIVEGHTDNSPLKTIYEKQYPYEDNMGLSLFRAKTVAGMFEKEGIPSKRISAIGYGDTRPIATNATNEGRAQNRRVVVRLIPEEKGI